MTGFIGLLAQESTPSIIADKLRQAIGHGELKPGAQLGEAELARRFGVSRGPVARGACSVSPRRDCWFPSATVVFS